MRIGARFYSEPGLTGDNMVNFLNTGYLNSGLIILEVSLPMMREWGRLPKASAKGLPSEKAPNNQMLDGFTIL
jgi:hypothetical protein